MSLPVQPLHFQPLHFCWAALHPRPRGVVVFIGGAFFGTFPTVFYRRFLSLLHAQGYTVVALPFRFSFRHWSIALSLVAYQDELRRELAELATRLGHAPDPYVDWKPFTWIGHSLGCKYLALLELLSDLELDALRRALADCVGADQAGRLIAALSSEPLDHQSLHNQPTLLLDPVMADLEDAVPLPLLQKLLNRWIRVLPSRSESFCIVGNSRLFNLTSIVGFGSRLATATVASFVDLLGPRLRHLIRLEPRDHLAIMGVGHTDMEVVAAVSDWLNQEPAWHASGE